MGNKAKSKNQKYKPRNISTAIGSLRSSTRLSFVSPLSSSELIQKSKDKM